MNASQEKKIDAVCRGMDTTTYILPQHSIKDIRRERQCLSWKRGTFLKDSSIKKN